MLRFVSSLSFVDGLVYSDYCLRNSACPAEVRAAAELLQVVAHALWEPFRLSPNDMEQVCELVQNVQVNLSVQNGVTRSVLGNLHILVEDSNEDAASAVLAPFGSAIVDLIAIAGGKQDVRRCLDCSRWFSPPLRSGRSKFCTPRCRNAFNYRRRISDATLRCARCSLPFPYRDATGLYQDREAGCVMGSLRDISRLLCLDCVGNHDTVWLSYALGEPRPPF